MSDILQDYLFQLFEQNIDFNESDGAINPDLSLSSRELEQKNNSETWGTEKSSLSDDDANSLKVAMPKQRVVGRRHRCHSKGKSHSQSIAKEEKSLTETDDPKQSQLPEISSRTTQKDGIKTSNFLSTNGLHMVNLWTSSQGNRSKQAKNKSKEPFSQNETKSVFEFMDKHNCLLYMKGNNIAKVMQKKRIVRRGFAAIQSHVIKQLKDLDNLGKVLRNESLMNRIRQAVDDISRNKHRNHLTKDDIAKKFRIRI